MKQKVFQLTNTNSTILLIEDYTSLRLALTEYLSDQYTIIAVENGIKALEVLENTKVDLIILDLMLPFPLDGYAILKILKNNSKLAMIPVIIISTLNNENDILTGLENGAIDFLVKPFSEKQLKVKINNHLLVKKNIVKDLETNYILNSTSTHPCFTNNESDFKTQFDKLVEELLHTAECTIPAIAKKMSMSIASLERGVKRVYGTTPNKYILDFKLRKAEIMLRQKMGNVTEVSYALGFNSVSYFCNCFKKKYKTTATDLLKSK